MTSPLTPPTQVHEVHDWPERAALGPRIVVWHGRNKRQAQQVRDKLQHNAEECGLRFRYEVVP